MAIFHGNAIPSGDTTFSIKNSCRFDGTSGYLSKTFGAAGNNKKYTVSFWCKRSKLGTYQNMFSPYPGGGNLQISWDASTGDKIEFYYHSGGFIWNIVTTQLFRDPSAWYHIVIVYDSAQVTNTNRIKIFVNGTQVTAFDTAAYPGLNVSGVLLDSTPLQIGAKAGASFFDGYLAEVHVLDDTAVTDANDFGERGDYGEWKPIEVEGLTYGDNGFYLDFADSGDAGDDESGEGNDFAETGIATHDQMLDSPMNNFCTLNPVYPDSSHLSEGNLLFSATTNNRGNMATWDIPIGDKYYFEGVLVDVPASGNEAGIGVNIKTTDLEASRGGRSTSYSYFATRGSPDSDIDDWKWVANTSTDLGSQASIGDIVGIAVNRVDHELKMYRNNSLLATITIPSTDDLIPWIGTGGSTTLNRWAVNFGADGTFGGTKTAGNNADGNGYGNFFYAPPSGHLALCSKNLPDCAVIPSEHFGIMLTDKGAGARTFATDGVPPGAAFSPDLMWYKSRGGVENHRLTSRLQGVQQSMRSNQSNAETTESTGLLSFDVDGMTLGADGSYIDETGVGMVIWNWKANGTGASNELGSINTTATSANTAAGFSIITYSGTGNANDTVGHGLGVKPNFVIAKQRAGAVNGWVVGSVQPLASMNFTDNLVLDTTAAVTDDISRWHDLDPTDTLISIGTNNEVNMSGGTYVMYCWHSVEGYSKIGSYQGNSSADGTFIYTGFRPKFILNKAISNSEGWQMMDTARDSYNVASKRVEANSSAAEASASYTYVDFLSNGFKIRNTDGIWNNSSHTYLYMTFAEMPFKNATAR